MAKITSFTKKSKCHEVKGQLGIINWSNLGTEWLWAPLTNWSLSLTYHSNDSSNDPLTGNFNGQKYHSIVFPSLGCNSKHFSITNPSSETGFKPRPLRQNTITLQLVPSPPLLLVDQKVTFCASKKGSQKAISFFETDSAEQFFVLFFNFVEKKKKMGNIFDWFFISGWWSEFPLARP